MKAALLFAFTICTSFAFAQQEKVDMDVMKRIREEGLQHSQVPMIAHYITDVSGPRLTNSEGYKRASNWAVNTLKSWGLADAHLEPWGEFGRGWENEKCYAGMVAPYTQQIVAYPYAWTQGTDGEETGEVLLVDSLGGIGRYGDLLRGKIVMIKKKDTFLTEAFKPYASRMTDGELKKMSEAKMPEKNKDAANNIAARRARIKRMFEMYGQLKKMGVLALIITTDRNADGVVYSLGNGNYKKATEYTLPMLSIAREDQLRIQRLIADGTPVKLSLDIRSKFNDKDLTAYNVIAEIPGTDPSLSAQVVMIGAHLDSWHNATGATDNAAGSIAAMEAIRILQTLHLRPRRTIRIALWSGEEQGLLGSHGYVKKHFGDQSTMTLMDEQKNISAYYNLDNGSGKIRGVFLQSNAAAGPIFQQWLQPFNDLGATTVTLGNTGSTDHISFDAVGIPAFQFIQDPLEYGNHTHHSNLDNYDHLFMDDLKQAAVVMAAFVYNTAMRDEQIPRKALPDATPSYD